MCIQCHNEQSRTAGVICRRLFSTSLLQRTKFREFSTEGIIYKYQYQDQYNSVFSQKPQHFYSLIPCCCFYPFERQSLGYCQNTSSGVTQQPKRYCCDKICFSILVCLHEPAHLRSLVPMTHGHVQLQRTTVTKSICQDCFTDIQIPKKKKKKVHTSFLIDQTVFFLHASCG